MCEETSGSSAQPEGVQSGAGRSVTNGHFSLELRVSKQTPYTVQLVDILHRRNTAKPGALEKPSVTMCSGLVPGLAGCMLPRRSLGTTWDMALLCSGDITSSEGKPGLDLAVVHLGELVLSPALP